MPRNRPATKQINLPATPELYAQIAQYAKEQGSSITSLFWRALAAQYPDLTEIILKERT